MLEAFFLSACRVSLEAIVLIVFIVALQWAGRDALTAGSRYALSFLVLIRLCLPIVPSSPFSIFNLFRSGDAVLIRSAVESEPSTGGGLPAPSGLVHHAASGTGALVRGIVPEAPVPSSLSQRMAGVFGADWPLLLSWLWFLGGAGLWARYLCGYAWWRRSLREARCLLAEPVARLFEECKTALGVKRNVRLLVSPLVFSPTLSGIWKPSLILPPGLAERFDPVELRFIFLHELQHLKRGDLITNALMIGVQCWYWFNPFVWWALRRLKADREAFCDAVVLRGAGALERQRYGETLLKLLSEFQKTFPGTLSMINHKPEIRRRITMISQFKSVRRVHLAWISAVMAALACLTFTRAAEKRSPAMAAKEKPSVTDSQPEAWYEAGIKKLEEELERQKKRVAEAEDRLQAMRPPAALPVEESDALRQLSAERITVVSKLVEQTSLLEELQKESLEQQINSLSVTLSDSQLGGLLGTEMQLEQKTGELEEQYGPAHPTRMATKHALDRVRIQIRERVERIKSGMESQIKVLRSRQAALEKEMRGIQAASQEQEALLEPYNEAKRDLARARQHREAIQLKIIQEKIDRSIPRSLSP